MTLEEAKKNFAKAAEDYIKAMKESGDDMHGDALAGFMDGWLWKDCKYTYEENECYSMGYGPGENHLIP